MGAFVGIGAGQSLKRIGADEPWIVSCALEFERATGEGTLHIRDNFVTAYHVRLPVVPRDWSPAPDDKAYWKDRGQEVLRAYASGDTLSAYSLMAAEFQAEWTLSQFGEYVETAAESFGAVREVKFVSEAESTTPFLIEMYFHIQGDEQSAYVKVRFKNALAHTGIVGIGPATAEEAEGGQ